MTSHGLNGHETLLFIYQLPGREKVTWVTGPGAFADALIAELGARAGSTHTLTFDKKALWLPGFTVP